MQALDLSYFDRYQRFSILLFRLTFGVHLLIYAGDNVFSYPRMLEFRDFLQGFGVPYPLVAAFVSVYVQFACGLLLILGFKVRLAGFLIFIHFIFALIIAHIGTPYQAYFPAAQLVAVGLFFLLQGAGPISIDARIQKPSSENPPALA
jgi:putative oxidoreductase